MGTADIRGGQGSSLCNLRHGAPGTIEAQGLCRRPVRSVFSCCDRCHKGRAEPL
ncbi:hypothetical protein [Methanogenium cariaci]|uniref:hypothetical protein n=1 Tax=Methanogenium cariaci TaxID=2197 RepID=UPI00155DD255|nr:hypothetical protein [Methanogenium cariaci]